MLTCRILITLGILVVSAVGSSYASDTQAAGSPKGTEGTAPTSVGTLVDKGMLKQYEGLRRVLIAAVEKMPDDRFDARPHKDARSFAETAAHIAAANLSMCSYSSGQPIPRETMQARLTAAVRKDTILAMLREGLEMCDILFKAPGDERAASIRAAVVIHSWQVYGSMAVYLRMQGIVPPTTEEAQRK